MKEKNNISNFDDKMTIKIDNNMNEFISSIDSDNINIIFVNNENNNNLSYNKTNLNNNKNNIIYSNKDRINNIHNNIPSNIHNNTYINNNYIKKNIN